MAKPFQRLRRFLSELRRRNVYRVAVTYAVVAFVVWQVADFLFPALGFPAWTIDFVIVLTLLGFPLALVVAWAFEMTPDGMRRTAEPAGADEGTEAGIRAGYKMLVGLGLAAAAVAGGWYLVGGGGETPKVTEGTVAVLPFQVSGSGAEDWRDGMVTMLTPGLNGAAGLRAISDRTVFAAWEQQGQVNRGASTQEAVAVARQVGAEYAVVGSAVRLQDELRFTASVHNSRSGDRLGQVQVRGSPDSVPALADSLARRALSVLLGENTEEFRPRNLASITTHSLPALKFYLAGERHFRAGEYEDAVEEYESAVAEDSAFALAYGRLATAYGWLDRFDAAVQYQKRAYEFSERLPPREQARVRAGHLRYEGRARAAVDTLQRALDRYPDDPALWYDFGEVLIHGYVPPGWPRAEEAFRRAIALNPEVAAYHHHFVDLGFALHRDSALVAKRIAAHPGGPMTELHQLAWNLVFGGEERRERTWARIDTGAMAYPRQLAEWTFLHPADGKLSNRVLHRLRGRDEVDDDFMRFLSVFNEMRQGHVKDALELLERVPPGGRTCRIAYWMMVDIPVPDSAREPPEVSASLRRDTLQGRDVGRLYCGGLLLMEQGHREEVGAVVTHLQTAVAGETASAEGLEIAASQLSAYRAWKAGDLNRAVERWPSSGLAPNAVPFAVPRALWRGDLSRDRGEFEEAEGWYLATWRHPVAHERLGQLYEKMNRLEEAAAAYRRFIAAWKNADPELQPRVEAARERLKQLTAMEDDTDE